MVSDRTQTAFILVSVGTLLSVFRLPRFPVYICRDALIVSFQTVPEVPLPRSGLSAFWVYTFVDHIDVVDAFVSIYSYSEHASLFCDVDMPITPTLGNGGI